MVQVYFLEVQQVVESRVGCRISQDMDVSMAIVVWSMRTMEEMKCLTVKWIPFNILSVLQLCQLAVYHMVRLLSRQLSHLLFSYDDNH